VLPSRQTTEKPRKKNMMKMIAIDVETGGLNPYSDALCSVAAFCLATGEACHFLIRPSLALQMEAEAIGVHGLTRERLAVEGRPENEVLDELTEWLERFGKDWEICGANPQFDLGFLRQAYARWKKRFPLGRRPVDIQGMAWLADRLGILTLPTKDGRPTASLDAIAETLDMGRAGKEHDALEDAILTARIHRRLMTTFKEALK
jgi:DNA polymerase III epsilon subunit-like protein